ncbi:Fanconi anemia group J protein-like protein [Hypsibius exemplaris]|uniref:DNA 5'-3' helicase n=1 Tax=Hypsibius exemplaris TaxID=2072580 RepID=A0A1W0WNV6_HYPEX|nr:Fanconi anemia group J protein-like protein [Hypsibius exemplaris]
MSNSGPQKWQPTKKATPSMYAYQWPVLGSPGTVNPNAPTELRVKNSSPSPATSSTFSSTSTKKGKSAPFKSVVPPEAAPPAPGGKTYTICGVKVDFPHQAYPSQVGVMDKVLRCLTTNQNGLLESPTGSGKSLALLCSSLAWQIGEYEKEARARCGRPDLPRKPSASVMKDLKPVVIEGAGDGEQARASTIAQIPAGCGGDSTSASEPGVFEIDDAGNIIHLRPDSSIPADGRCCSSSSSAVVCNEFPQHPETAVLDRGHPSCEQDAGPRKPLSFQANKRRPKGVIFDEPDISEDDDDGGRVPDEVMARIQSRGYSSTDAPRVYPGELATSDERPTMPSDNVEKIPKIYFGSRTHKQISQLVRELNKTSYKQLRMAILGSKDQYCIHPVVSRQRNKNEACQELLDEKTRGDGSRTTVKMTGCEYYNAVKQHGNFKSMAKFGLKPVYDIEDLSQVGKRNVVCPFFASKDLAKSAQLIFCPYNYLIDARIRAAMNIDLAGQIVIFDEGHNMEDASREASSYVITTDQLRDAIDDMAKVTSGRRGRGNGGGDDDLSQFSEIHGLIQDVMHRCRGLSEWMESAGRNIPIKFNGGSKELSGADFVLQLGQVGLGPDEFVKFSAAVEEITADKAEGGQDEGGRGTGSMGRGDAETKQVSGGTLMVLRGLLVVLGYMYNNAKAHLTDYRFVLMKEANRNNAYIEDESGYRRKRKQEERSEWLYRLNFWCLNPAVAFGDFLKAKAVVLTSGTLSPIASFQSELGMKFGIQFEANHVIAMEQVWAGGVGHGPHNTILKATHGVTEQLSFQDDVGDAVLQVCRTVPKGVLCFFTSYAVMGKLMTRWQESGLMLELQKCKVVLEEPRNSFGDKSIFENVMEEFYAAIRGVSLQGDQTGALMFAVCRGKISEGLDFADDNARAVIAVGIPYPNFMDEQVKMKRAYNDTNIKKGLLSGANWYDIQAFRALNQALGRCLRHKNDWGALILLDVRFTEPQTSKNIQGLSKWLRPQIHSYAKFSLALASLDAFVSTRLAADAMRRKEGAAAVVQQEAKPSSSSRPASISGLKQPPVIAQAEDAENAVTDSEVSSFLAAVSEMDDNLLTDDELSSLFTSDEDFSPQKPKCNVPSQGEYIIHQIHPIFRGEDTDDGFQGIAQRVPVGSVVVRLEEATFIGVELNHGAVFCDSFAVPHNVASQSFDVTELLLSVMQSGTLHTGAY